MSRDPGKSRQFGNGAMIEIVTPRLTLRPYRDDDLDHVIRLYGDPVVTRYTKLGRRSAAEARAILAEYVSSWGARGFGMLAALLQEDGAFVGEFGFFELGPSKRVALRYALLDAYWGRGLAVEAMAPVLDWGFAELGLAEVAAVVQRPNAASHRLALRLGMTVEREARDGDVELLFYRLDAAAWRAARDSLA